MLNLCQQTSTVILRTLYLTIAAAGHWSQHNVNYEQWSCVLCQQSVEVVCIFTFSWESALQCHDKQCIWHQRRPAHETPIPGGSACHWALCAVHMVMVMVMYTNDHNVTMSQCHNVTMLSAHGDVQQWSHITIQCSLYVKYCMRQHFFAVCVCH